jgi:hypothetical protein
MAVEQAAHQHLWLEETAAQAAVVVGQLQQVAALVVQAQQIKDLMVQQIPVVVMVELAVEQALLHLLELRVLVLLL